MFYHRFLKRVLPCLTICTCLAAGKLILGAENTTPNVPSAQPKKLWNRPVTRGFLSPQPDAPAAMLQPPPAECGVAPLPPITDAEALAAEKGASPDTGNLKPALARAMEKFQQLVNSVGGRFELKSAYRPPAYQEHLQEVWFKWMLELRRNRQPACQTLRAQVGEEFAGHHLLETQKPVTSSDHTRGLAFDATVIMPMVARLKKRYVSLDRLARLAGIQRPDIRRDPVHFRLAVNRGIRRG